MHDLAPSVPKAPFGVAFEQKGLAQSKRPKKPSGFCVSPPACAAAVLAPTKSSEPTLGSGGLLAAAAAPSLDSEDKP